MDISEFIYNSLTMTNMMYKNHNYTVLSLSVKKMESNTIIKYFEKIFNNEEINFIHLNHLIQQIAYHNISAIYAYYYNMITKISNELIDDISNIIKNYTSSEKIFIHIETELFKFTKKCQQFEIIMKNCDQKVIQIFKHTNFIFFDTNLINNLMIMKIINTEINGKTLMNILDDRLEDYLHGINLIAELVKIYNNLIKDNYTISSKLFPYFHKITFEKKIYKIFLNNIGKINYDSSHNLFIWLSKNDINFIPIYQSYFEDRIKTHKSLDLIKYELDLLNLLTIKNNQYKHTYYDSMKKQLNEIKTQIELNEVFQKFHVIIEKEEYKNLEFNNEISHFEIYNNYIWKNDKPKNKIILPNEIKIYDDVFKKIYNIENKHNELTIDDKKSNSIINIEINNNSYNFLVTFQQLLILITIIKEKEITLQKIQEATGIKEDELEVVLNSLYSCDLLSFENDLFSINKNFFFTSNDINLINTIDYNEKYDERIISDIVDIIINNKFENVEQIFNKYIELYGFINLNLINNMMKYLINQTIIIHNQSYSINHEDMNELDNIIMKKN
jgi:hypothetical protein